MEEFYREQIEAVLNYVTYYKLSTEEVYKLLASYGIDEGTKGEDRTELKNRCASYAENLIRSYSSSGYKLIPHVQDQGNYFRHINVTFDKNKDKGVRDVVKLYIPIRSEALEYGTSQIYNYLFQNGINFQSKISGTERAEMFVLRVDSVEDARKVIDFCSSKPEIYRNYTSTNPFMAHVNGIGVAKDTYNRSYNQYVASCISEYARTHNPRESYTTDFMEFIKNKYAHSNNSQDRYMAATTLENMLAITGGTNVLDSYNEEYYVAFDPNFFYSYKRYRDRSGYFYEDSMGNRINMETNPSLYISLQAQNCMHKMFTEEYSTPTQKIVPTRRFKLPSSMANKISRTTDRMMDAKVGAFTPVAVDNNYTMEEVRMLLPYLYADFAQKYKYADIEECKKIAVTVFQNQRVRIPDSVQR